MGRYINVIDDEHIGHTFVQKCSSLEKAGAIPIDPEDEFVDNMVVVIDNGHFAAAAYAYNKREFEGFIAPYDVRPKQWYQYEYADRDAKD